MCVCVCFGFSKISRFWDTVSGDAKAGGTQLLSGTLNIFFIGNWRFPQIGLPQNGWFKMENPSINSRRTREHPARNLFDLFCLFETTLYPSERALEHDSLSGKHYGLVPCDCFMI